MYICIKKGGVNKTNNNARDVYSARFLKRVINRDKAYVTPCLKRVRFSDDTCSLSPGLYFDIKKASRILLLLCKC